MILSLLKNKISLNTDPLGSRPGGEANLEDEYGSGTRRNDEHVMGIRYHEKRQSNLSSLVRAISYFCWYLSATDKLFIYAGGGHTRRVERGWGVDILEDARHSSVLYLYLILFVSSTHSLPLSLFSIAHSGALTVR
jgi:hypothetical protein